MHQVQNWCHCRLLNRATVPVRTKASKHLWVCDQKQLEDLVGRRKTDLLKISPHASVLFRFFQFSSPVIYRPVICSQLGEVWNACNRALLSQVMIRNMNLSSETQKNYQDWQGNSPFLGSKFDGEYEGRCFSRNYLKQWSEAKNPEDKLYQNISIFTFEEVTGRANKVCQIWFNMTLFRYCTKMEQVPIKQIRAQKQMIRLQK